MTITCPKCGFVFDTEAVTNTRCRNCRHVVNIGRRPRSAESPRSSSTSYTPAYGDDETPGLSPVAIGLGLAGAGALAIWHGTHLHGGDDPDPEALTRARLRWCVGGGLMLGLGGLVLYFSLRS